MFRLTVIFGIVLSAATAYHVRSSQQSSSEQHGYHQQQQHPYRSHSGAAKYYAGINAVDLIESYGYIAESYTVTTSDGYILDVIRIPHGLQNGQSQPQSQYGYSQGQNEYGQASSQKNYYRNNRNEPYSSSSSSSEESSDESYNGPYSSGFYAQKRQQQHQQQQQQHQQQQQQYVNKRIHQYSSSEYSQQHQQNLQYSGNEQDPQGDFRPAVLLMPGIISSADDYILGGPENGLAFVLADEGYDVYLGNVRGSKYGRKHTTLNPDTDSTFWDFCWDDIAVKDLPTIIDSVLRESKMPKIYYVGHMQGSTLFYVMASEMPEYNKKIRNMISLGPLAFLGQNENKMVEQIKNNMHLKGWVVKNLGTAEFKPSSDLLRDGGGSDCILRSKVSNSNFCNNIYFLLNGYNSDNLNVTTLAPILAEVPKITGVSVRQMLHLGQLFKSDRFAKYSSTSQSGQEYNLDKVSTPVYILYTPKDEMSTRSDVERLIRRLPNVQQAEPIKHLSNNLDLLFANNVNEIVNTKVVKYLATR